MQFRGRIVASHGLRGSVTLLLAACDRLVTDEMRALSVLCALQYYAEPWKIKYQFYLVFSTQHYFNLHVCPSLLHVAVCHTSEFHHVHMSRVPICAGSKALSKGPKKPNNQYQLTYQLKKRTLKCLRRPFMAIYFENIWQLFT